MTRGLGDGGYRGSNRTARGWLRAAPRAVVSLEVTTLSEQDLQHEVLQLRRRVQKLAALLRLVLAVLRVSGFTLSSGQQRGRAA